MSSSLDQRPIDAPCGIEVTDDAFLGGRVRLWQPAKGYRAGLDAVMLAAAVPAHPRERICDLGLGVGAASLCLAARVTGLHVTGVEIAPSLLNIARANFARNRLTASFELVVADILKRPKALARQSFHHVIANPPFHAIERGTRAPRLDKAHATSAAKADLQAWLRFARALVRPSGWLTFVLPAEQLASALAAVAPDGMGAEIVPLWPKAGLPAKRVIVRIRMNSQAGLRLSAGLVLHGPDGAFTREADAVLRHGGALAT